MKATEVFCEGRYAHLRRDRLRRGGTTFLRGNPVHVDKLVELFGMEKANPARTPSLPDRRDEAAEALDEQEIAKYRKAVGILLYAAVDRWDIKRDVEICARSLAAPTWHDRKRVIRIVKYLKGTREWGHKLELDRRAAPGLCYVDMYSDTNYAPDDGTRRAMSCGVIMVDGVAYHCYAKRQAVQSTSSGEAEFYGASSVAMDGRLIWHLMEWLGYEVIPTLYVDSAAAKGMLLRDGVGAVKHLDVRSLWVQQERHRGLRIRKIPGEQNVADLGTKDHSEQRFKTLRALACMVDCSMIDAHEERQALAISLSTGAAETGNEAGGAAPPWAACAIRLWSLRSA